MVKSEQTMVRLLTDYGKEWTDYGKTFTVYGKEWTA